MENVDYEWGIVAGIVIVLYSGIRVEKWFRRRSIEKRRKLIDKVIELIRFRE